MRCTEETEIPDALSHPARTPVRGILRRAFQGLHNDGLNTDILDRTRSTRARLVMQPVQPMLDKAAAPFAYRSLGNAQASGNFPVLHASRAFKNNPRPQCQRLRRLAPSRKQLQFRALRLAKNQLCHLPTRHHKSPCSLRLNLTQQRESTMTRTSDSGH